MKPIPGLADYFADHRGIIWSTKPGRNRRYKKPHVLMPWEGRRGYLRVTIARKHYLVHRLVCSAFSGDSGSGLVCMHLNRDVRDNRPSNLKFGSQAENKSHELAHGTKLRGSKSPWATIDEAMALEIKRRIASGIGVTAISRDLGVHLQTVSAIRGNRNWTHIPWPEGFVSRPRPREKLTKSQVARIRKMIASGKHTQQEIGARFGVNETTIRDIKSGRTRRQ